LGGRDLLYQFGVGLGFLSTVRRDGGPRVHPICPILHDDQLREAEAQQFVEERTW
jgi:hypothetical protein